MSDTKLVKTVFCVGEQKETQHVLSANSNAEVILTCETCGKFVKYPAGIKKDELDALLIQHRTSNEGQITQDSINANLAELADDEIKIEAKETETEIK